jgi:hypothetical protein
MHASTANSQARLSAEDLHQLRWLLGLALALLALWTLLCLETGSTPLLLAAAAMVAGCLIFPGLPGWLPAWFWRWSVPVIVIAIIGDFVYSRADVLPALVRMVTLLTLYRCLQYRKRREDLQLILLCLFMTILSGVLTLSLLFGVQILIFSVMAMALLFVINLLQAQPERALTRADWAHFQWRSFLMKLIRGMDVRLHLMAGLLFLAMVATSTVIFVSMPRFSFEHSMSFAKLKGQSGFNEKVTYGRMTQLETDNGVAFRVDVPTGVTFATTPYWRMVVLDKYSNNEFQASYAPALPQDYQQKTTVGSLGALRLGNVPRPPGEWKFYMEGDVSEYLPLLGQFGNLTFSMPQAYNGSVAMQVYRIQDIATNVLGYEVGNMDIGDAVPATRTEARFFANAHPGMPVAETAPKASPQMEYGLPPDKDDRAFLKATVDKLRGGRTDMSEVEFMGKAIEYLHNEHPPALSLSLTPLPDNSKRDALVHWMNSKSSGWCEYYAGAFVLLARAAGYPARMVAGFRGASFNDIEHYYVVRNSDAHAWAEIYDGKDRWLRVDPTPGAEVPFAGAATAGTAAYQRYEQGWSARLDSLRMLWYRRVINFDQTDQKAYVTTLAAYGKVILKSIRDQVLGYWHWLSAWFEAPLTTRRIAEIWALIGMAGLLVIFRRRLLDGWLRLSARGWLARVSHDSPVRRRAGRWLRQMEPAWSAWVGTLPIHAQADWAAARRELLALRYGPLETMPDPIRAFDRARALLKTARRERSRWRAAQK